MANVIETLVVKIASDITAFENGISSALKKSAEFEQGIKKIGNLGEGINKIGKGIADVGESLTKKITLPIMGVVGAAVKLGNDFEAQMSRVKGIAGATASEFDALRQNAIDLGASTAFSASEVALGMENLASAGFEANEILAAMPGMLDLAASSGAELGLASEYAASTLRGFGLAAGDAGHVADVYAVAAAKTNAQTEDMGYAMKYAAPVMHAYKISMEETAASIGILSDAGIKGSQAGTTLRGAFTRLVKPTDKMLGVMDDLGVTFFNAEGQMKSISTIIGELGQATAGLTDEQKNHDLAVLFGMEALSGMLALMDAGPDKISKLTEELINSDGAAKQMAETMMDNTKGAIEEMMGALETAAITIQTILAPAIQAGAEKIGELANKFTALPEGTQKTILAIAGIVAAIGPVLFVVGKVTGAIGFFIEAFSKIANLAPLISKIGPAFSVLTGPIGIAVAAVAALIAVFVGLYNTNEEFRGKIQEIWAGISAFLASTWESVKALAEATFNALKDFWDKWGDDILGFFSTIWDGIGVVVNAALDVLILIVTSTFDLIKAFWDKWGADIIGFFQKRFNEIKAIAEIVFKALKDFWAIWGDGIKILFETIWKVVSTLFESGLKVLENLFKVFKGILTLDWQTLWTGLKGILETILNTIKTVFKTIFEGLLNIASTVFSNMKTVVSQKFSDVKNTISNLLDDIKNFFTNLPSQAVTWGKNLIQGFIDGIKNMASAVSDAVSNVIDNVADFMGFNSPSKKGKGRNIVKWGRNMIGGFVDGIIQAVPTVKATMDKVIPDVSKSLSQIKVSGNAGKEQLQAATTGSNQKSIGDRMLRTIINMEGLFKGAEIVIRNEADLEKLAKLVIEKLDDFMRQSARNRGLEGA